MNRSELDPSDYGLPEKKKYPMPDAKHVKLAIKFFNYADPEDQPKLATAIKRKAKKFGVIPRCGKKNKFSEYITKEYITEFMAASSIGGMYGVITGSIKQGMHESNPKNLGFEYVASADYPYSKKKKRKKKLDDDNAALNESASIGINVADIYLVSDVHISFSNIDRLNDILSVINGTVPEDKVLFILGDLFAHEDEKGSEADVIYFLSHINCKNIILVKGNHDILPDSVYYKGGVKEVVEAYRIGEVLFTHKPTDLSKIDLDVKYNIHGHNHGEGCTRHDYPFYDDRFYFDVWNDSHKPITLDSVLDELVDRDNKTVFLH